MSSDTSKLGGFAITILDAYWAYDRACTDLGIAIDAVKKVPATHDQLASIRASARAVLAKGEDYRKWLVVAMDDVFYEDSNSEARLLQELGQLRDELEKAAVYDTDEFERLNGEPATSLAGDSLASRSTSPSGSTTRRTAALAPSGRCRATPRVEVAWRRRSTRRTPASPPRTPT